jgi:NADH:ubiquinone oxidoreductase subunit K
MFEAILIFAIGIAGILFQKNRMKNKEKYK